jgi:hypothetical protein
MGAGLVPTASEPYACAVGAMAHNVLPCQHRNGAEWVPSAYQRDSAGGTRVQDVQAPYIDMGAGLVPTASEPNASAVGAMAHDVPHAQHRNGAEWVPSAYERDFAGGTRAHDVQAPYIEMGAGLVPTASEPKASAVGAMAHDVPHAQHRNGARWVTTASEPNASAVGAMAHDVPHGQNRNGDRLMSTASEANASAVGQHRNGAMSVSTASEPNASAVGAMAHDVRHGEHRNGWSRLAPSGVQHSAGSANHDFQSEMHDVRVAQHRNEDVLPCQHRNERSGLVPSGVQHSAGGTHHASQNDDVRVA